MSLYLFLKQILGHSYDCVGLAYPEGIYICSSVENSHNLEFFATLWSDYLRVKICKTEHIVNVIWL